MAQDRTALGAFLRSRRDRITPAQAGMTPFPGARRVPGLRKEELAVLAGLSPDYYSRLEQGRQANISVEVLDGLARALRLDDVERAHLHDLAAPAARSRHRHRHRPEPEQVADPGLLRVLSALDHLPALLLGNRSQVLARNTLLSEVLGHAMEPGTLFNGWLLTDPGARDRIINWPDFARAAVATMRREAGRRPHDRRLHTDIQRLRRDPDIARWWDDHGVRDYASMTKRIRHPVAGDLTFGVEMLTGPLDPDQRLIVYTVEPDSATARVLPMLASWAATAPAPPNS
ncbi:helix-turn-helix transcriptional regulator [Kineosporia mesophila]|uniref:Helix-turn-helix transcriptional regulator n=1 Tax=Kineosporia mesophila TaxID=566012 RepID=A0ABP6ZG33_9ACTN|nr:helix-turn-helix transcriptional regulator [Kineosporia mesophila]MCD5350593.1 helix-turn-helix transcriptional regulator [Kineosporia mesophila]